MPTEPRTFTLYPEERHWWSFNDYGAVLDVTRRLKAKRVVEFGPGSSTLSLIEGGATKVDCCEDNPDWFGVYQERLARRFPDVVTLHAYTVADPLDIPALTKRRYDMGLVDGPHGTLDRPAVIAWCLQRCRAVLVPTEDIAYGRSALRPHISALADQYGRTVEWMETGPLSGGFALLIRRGRERR